MVFNPMIILIFNIVTLLICIYCLTRFKQTIKIEWKKYEKMQKYV